MWALCDLAMSLLVSKSTTYELKEFPTEPTISTMFFAPPEDPNFFNTENYLPPELVVQPPKKLGITIQYLQPSSAANKKKRVSDHSRI
jgi:sister-chromatid-cohesion protein PDS5